MLIAENKSFYASDLPKAYKSFGSLNLFTITKPEGDRYRLSIFIVIVIAVILITWFILRFTILGKGIYAVGGNLESAKRSGFNIMKIHFFVYCYMGFLAGMAAIMKATRLQSVILVGYSVVDLSVIAAVILGGARIAGGYGTIAGTIFGVIIIVILKGNLVLLGLSSFWNEFIIGLVIIIGVLITTIQEKRKNQGFSIIKV